MAREWTEIAESLMDGVDGGALFVADEHVGHMTPLADDSAAELNAALADYAAGYDAGDAGGRCKVRWEVWVDGELQNSGVYRFGGQPLASPAVVGI